MTAPIARIIKYAALVVISCLPLDVAAQVSISRERLPVATREAIRRGTVVKQSPTTRDTVAAQANAVVLGRNEVLVARTRAPYLDRVIPRADTAGGQVGQGGQDSVYNLGIEVTGVVPGTQQLVTYKAQFIPHGGAYYSPASGRYEGHFSVAVVDANGASYALAAPLTMTFGGDPETYEPPNVSVTRAGDVPSRVKLLARTASDSVAIKIFMGSDTDGVPFRIPVQSTLHISGPGRMEGFGVDVAKYQISVDGPGGPGLQVGVVTDRGSLDKDEIQLGPSGTGSVGLKSGDGSAPLLLRPAHRTWRRGRFRWSSGFLSSSWFSCLLAAPLAPCSPNPRRRSAAEHDREPLEWLAQCSEPSLRPWSTWDSASTCFNRFSSRRRSGASSRSSRSRRSAAG